MNELAGKVAYITGGSKGIGFGIAQTLLNAGMKVAITSRHVAAAEEAAKKLSGDTSTVLAIESDVSAPESEAAAIQKIIADGKASFKVCSMTMKRNNIDASQLIPGVEIVPDGIYEIVSRQQDGWGYVKVGH